MSDENLEKELKTYQEIAKENPNVDVNMLMMNALQTENSKLGSGKSYKWPYMIAISLPPIGLLFALKYYYSDDEQDKTAAKLCVLLTVVSVIMFFALGKSLFSSSGASMKQIEQITPQDIHEAVQ